MKVHWTRRSTDSSYISAQSETYILLPDYFTSSQNPHHEELIASLQGLQSDKDRDVRYFACLQANSDSDNGIPHAYDTVSRVHVTFGLSSL